MGARRRWLRGARRAHHRAGHARVRPLLRQRDHRRCRRHARASLRRRRHQRRICPGRASTYRSGARGGAARKGGVMGTPTLRTDGPDARNLHALFLTERTTLAVDESFEWATRERKTARWQRRAWRDLDALLTEVERAVNTHDIYLGLAVRRCPKGGVPGRCGCRNPFDGAHVARVMSAAADLDVKLGPRGFASKK